MVEDTPLVLALVLGYIGAAVAVEAEVKIEVEAAAEPGAEVVDLDP